MISKNQQSGEHLTGLMKARSRTTNRLLIRLWSREKECVCELDIHVALMVYRISGFKSGFSMLVQDNGRDQDYCTRKLERIIAVYITERDRDGCGRESFK